MHHYEVQLHLPIHPPSEPPMCRKFDLWYEAAAYLKVALDLGFTATINQHPTIGE